MLATGLYPVRTLGGGKYVLTLYDEYSTVCAVSILKDLKHAGDELRRMILAWKAIHGLLPKVIHSDRGGCYIDGPMKEWCLEHGISQNFSSPRTPQQNGKAERLNQTLNDIMRSLLFQYGTHLPLWGHAMTYASLIYNVALCKRLGMTRYEAFIGVKPDVSNFRTFGCKVFARVDDTERTKLDPKSQVGIYLGPQLDGPGYKVLVYDPELKARHKYAVHIVRDMVTYEDLTVVTGAQDVSQLHWGGEIPLPTPLLEAHEPQPLEQLTGEPLPIALTEGAPMATPAPRRAELAPGRANMPAPRRAELIAATPQRVPQAAGVSRSLARDPAAQAPQSAQDAARLPIEESRAPMSAWDLAPPLLERADGEQHTGSMEIPLDQMHVGGQDALAGPSHRNMLLGMKRNASHDLSYVPMRTMNTRSMTRIAPPTVSVPPSTSLPRVEPPRLLPGRSILRITPSNVPKKVRFAGVQAPVGVTPSPIQRFVAGVANLAYDIRGIPIMDLEPPFATAFMASTPYPSKLRIKKDVFGDFSLVWVRILKRLHAFVLDSAP